MLFDFYMLLSKIMVSYLKDLNALRDDMIELKPTVLAGVPRVFEKVHEGMEATDQSAKT
jgi:long-chain acyl-CoA synthetase